MTVIKKKHSTRIFGTPSNWDTNKHGNCVLLPVTDYEGVMYSYWKTTWKERLQILFGYNIRLCVVGESHPPVALDIEV